MAFVGTALSYIPSINASMRIGSIGSNEKSSFAQHQAEAAI